MQEPITICLIPIQGKVGAGKFAIIDPDDYERVSKHRWLMDRDGYAVTWIRTPEGRRNVGMHRFINRTPSGLLTDHINGLKLDNRRSNLRSVTNSQNQANRGPMPGTSRYKGVSRMGPRRWVAGIKVDHKRRTLGEFTSEVAAARAYDRAARKVWGDHARLNFPDD